MLKPEARLTELLTWPMTCSLVVTSLTRSSIMLNERNISILLYFPHCVLYSQEGECAQTFPQP